MAGPDPDDYDDEQSPSSASWYNRTPAVIGASVVGLAVIGILIAAVTFVTSQFNEPEQAPSKLRRAVVFGDRHPIVVDADHDRDDHQHQSAGHHRHRRAVVHHLLVRPSSSDTSSSTDTSTRTAWTKPYTPPSGDESAPTTTRRGPRTNVTRTLYPQP